MSSQPLIHPDGIVVACFVPGAVSPLFFLADILFRDSALSRETVAVTGEVGDTAGPCGERRGWEGGKMSETGSL